MREWRWETNRREEREALARELGVTPTVAGLLIARGHDTPAAAHLFLNPCLEHLHDPFLLPDAEAAAERIARALDSGEKILVHGDYDVDGVAAAALFTRLLQTLGAAVECFIPHRQHDGYDLQVETVRRAAQEGVGLIVTVDCGILAFEAADAARELGVDLVITDHHQPDRERLPAAIAVVNPCRLDSSYPFRDLTGVGVAYKVALAVLNRRGVPDDSFRRNFLDLVALGTVSDCLPLVGENRVLVRFGLDALAASRKPGVRALLAAAKTPKPTASSIAFGLGPRLNAVGRLDAAELACRLLLTREEAEARELAARVERCNQERQATQSRVVAEAMEQADELDLRRTPVIVLANSHWHAGVVGIAAAKVAETTHRPAVLIALEGATGRGSARSVDGFHILEALRRCSDHLVRVGGHASAAGFEIRTEAVPGLREALIRVAAESLPAEPAAPALLLDDLLLPHEITERLARELGMLEPFGHGNPEPLFGSQGLPVARIQRLNPRSQGTADHLKLQLRLAGSHGKGEMVEAVWWRNGHRAEGLSENAEVDLCFRLELDTYWGDGRLRLNVREMRPSSLPVAGRVSPDNRRRQGEIEQ
jgi:single-stranded-DNA-specific exonuclease